MTEEETDKLAKLVWDYLQMHEKLQKADCILALGSYDVRVAHRAADLFNNGFAAFILFSGGFGRLTKDFPKSEAGVFAEEAIKLGVSKEKILIENKSTNTGENILFSMELLKKKSLPNNSFILVTKPYMERRAFATFKKHEPNKTVTVTSPLINYEDCAYDKFTKEDVINIILGDLQRIKVYPAKGYQIPQDIPADVWIAFEKLVSIGYNKQLIQ